MRPSATESLYKELDIQEGAYEYNLPTAFAIRPLRLSDVDQVMEVEAKGFPEHERAGRGTLEYRLKVCPELCCGVFQREFAWPSKETVLPDENDDAFGVVSKRSNLTRERLVAHIIATKMSSKFITEESMHIGAHKEDGESIAVHSVVVDPEFQGRHLGYIMMKDYVQKFFGLCNAERMSLIAKTHLVPFYAKHGFVDNGKSDCEYAGEMWHDLLLPFDTYDGQVEN